MYAHPFLNDFPESPEKKYAFALAHKVSKETGSLQRRSLVCTQRHYLSGQIRAKEKPISTYFT
jgi:hypothetical protein